MISRLTVGKQKGLEAVRASRGVIAAVAIDQRSALRSLFARSMGIEPENVAAERLIEFKQAVSSILTPHASAILLDPEYGLPAARLRSKMAGLLLAYEKTGYDKKRRGRLPSLLDHWSVARRPRRARTASNFSSTARVSVPRKSKTSSTPSLSASPRSGPRRTGPFFWSSLVTRKAWKIKEWS
jgi:tagatose 1,6-diphosphate aldolase